MPDNQQTDLFDAWGQALAADPATRQNGIPPPATPRAEQGTSDDSKAAAQPKQQVDLFDAWKQVLDADPSTQRSGIAPTAPQAAQGASSAAPATAQPSEPQAAPAPSQAPQSKPQSASAIASTAASLVGNTGASIVPFLRQNGQSLDSIRYNWCAAFVNGVLDANGVDGTQGPGKNVATSFLRWGAPVDGAPQPGDVLVQPRGHPAGGIGGHVGIATGQSADGNGQTYYLMQSGNLNGRVAYSWEPAQSVVVRRAPQTSIQAQAQQ